MAYTYPIISLNADGTFGPTKKGNLYLPVSYHNRTAKGKKGKNKFVIKQNEQYEIFRVADEDFWFCKQNNCLFSIIDGGNEVFGLLDERLAYFEPPKNRRDPWHGYPIFSSDYEISEDLLDIWETKGIVSRKIRKKIGNGQF